MGVPTTAPKRALPTIVMVAVILVALVAVVALGGVVLRRNHHNFQADAVGYVGDSITDQARGPLQTDLAADPNLIKAVGGIKIEEMVQPARDLAASNPQQVVINLGTNNVLATKTTDEEAASLQQLVDIFPAARCVHLVTINEHMVGQPTSDIQAGAVNLNQRIRSMPAADPRIHIIDWAQIVNDYDAKGDPDGPVTGDTVHPAAAGEKLLMDAYDASLSSC
jgi:hypothetical protein